MGVLRSVCMGLDGCGRSPGIDLDGVGWYGMSWMSIEGLGRVRRAYDWYEGFSVVVQLYMAREMCGDH